MSSDKLCFNSLVREVHKLLRTDPNRIKYELFYFTSTNTGRRIRASLQLEGFGAGPSMRDDYVPYFPHFYEGLSNPVDKEAQVETHADTREEEVEGEEEEEEREQEEVNDRTRLVESLLTEFSGWLRSSVDRTDRLLCLAGVIPPSTTGIPFKADGPSSNWVVPLADWDITGPVSWDKGHNWATFASKEMMAELVHEFGIHIDYSFALRMRNIAIEMAYGDFDKSYAQLPAFLHTLHLMNPGTVVDMEITGDGPFKHSFLALELCVNAFLQYARPVLVIDALGDIDDLLIVSDQHQSIKNTIEAVFPRAMHGLCNHHLKNKMKKRGKHVMDLFKEAAYAYWTDTFQESMSSLEQVCPSAYQKLCNIGPVRWSHSQYPVRRYGFMISNAWFVERRAAALGSNHVLTDGTMLKLSGNVEKGHYYAMRATTLATLWKVEVGREVYMVNLQNQTCDCREFELDLIPCSHAAAVICCTDGAIYDYMARYYRVESLVDMYNSVIRGLPHPEHWIVPDTFAGRVVLAPEIRRHVGHPSMSRARAPFEASSSARRHFCTRCHGLGHNKRVCIAHLPISGVDLNS
ncbi:hypothetical protein C2S52_020860 [Perilla frutescens var. hirtella]|nr:hypothetical protein C2S52_020860 [Perilla frutescens var. hirtella]